MVPTRLAVLVALLLAVLATVPGFAQTSSRALPLKSSQVHLVGATNMVTPQSVGTGYVGSVASDPIPRPYELVSLDYDATGSTVGASAPIFTWTYSDSSTGPFVAGVGSGFDNTVTLAVTPSSGANMTPYKARWGILTVSYTSPITCTLLRVDARRDEVDDAAPRRPQLLVDNPSTFDELTGLVIATGNTPTKLPTLSLLKRPDEIISFWLDTVTAATGTKKVKLYYANDPAGPYVAWEDKDSAGYISELSSTAVKVLHCPIKAYPSLYYKVGFLNSTGTDRTVTKLSQLKREQVKR